MKVEKMYYGLCVTIPATAHNSEFVYELRQVRRLNGNNRYEQPLLAEIEKREAPLTRRFLILAASMEAFFKTLPDDMAAWWETHTESPFDIWERKNKMNFNDYYHYGMADLQDEIDACSLEYCDRSRHGWCY